MRTLILSIAVLAAPAPLATAQEALPETGERWTIQFEPAVWYPAASGSVRLPGDTGSGNGSTIDFADLNIDSPRATPFGEIQARRGRWRLSVQGFGFGTDGRGRLAGGDDQVGAVPFSAGDRVSTSIDLLSFGVHGGYEFYQFEAGTLDNGGARVRSTLTGLVGIRAIDAEIKSEVVSGGTLIGSASGDALHAHPTVGIRWQLDLHEDFTIDLVSAIGGLSTGDTESWSHEILVGFQWNPTPHFGAQLGYRQFLLGVEDGELPSEFSWHGGLAGVYAGATLRF